MNKPVQLLIVALVAGMISALTTFWLFDEPRQVPGITRISSDYGVVSYADAVAAAAPAVVNVYTTKVTYEKQGGLLNDPLMRYLFGDRLGPRYRKKRQTSLGSGVIIDDQGHILTNNHVVADADEIRVVLLDGRSFEAEVAGLDPGSDLAVLSLKADDLPEIRIGNSDDLKVGDVLLAIGNPFGVGQTVTMGIVSATGRNQLGISTFENFIQTDAAINPGNSGGALINARGDLVGINTAIYSRSGGSMGIGFAIPITLAIGVMEQILEKGHVIRGWMGLAGQDITAELARALGLSDSQGVLISGVMENGPADKAGLEPGDVILSIDDHKPGSVRDILDLISALPPGSDVEVVGVRGGRKFSVQAEIIERPRMVE